MSQESNADVYASFGAGGVTTGGETSQHDLEMMKLDVATRDGDDEIKLANIEQLDESNDDPYGLDKDKFADEGSMEGDDDEGRTQVRINTDGEADELTDGEPQDNDEEGINDNADNVPSELPEPSEELAQSLETLSEHEQGFQDLVQTAVDKGITEDAIEKIFDEYEAGEGFSKATYEALEKAGYTKAFVDSYVAGQEAAVETYVSHIREYAGGEEALARAVKHLEATDPSALERFVEAVDSRDLSVIRMTLNYANQSLRSKYGKTAKRSVTQQGKPQGSMPTGGTKRVQGFASQAEMVKAMSDPRYQTDSAYRQEVEKRVWAM